MYLSRHFSNEMKFYLTDSADAIHEHTCYEAFTALVCVYLSVFT